MKVEITTENLLSNRGLMNLFFSSQSIKTLLEVIESVEDDKRQVASNIEDYSEDLDEIEEIFYNESVEDIIEMFCLRPINKTK